MYESLLMCYATIRWVSFSNSIKVVCIFLEVIEPASSANMFAALNSISKFSVHFHNIFFRSGSVHNCIRESVGFESYFYLIFLLFILVD